MEKMRSIFQKNKSITGTLLFTAFMLIQFVMLRLANQAGRGYLETDIQEKVYLFVQVIVIVGFLLYTMVYRRMLKTRGHGGFVSAVLGIVAVSVGIMLFVNSGSLFYLVITGIAVLFLGFIIGAVYLKLSEMIADGAKAGACIGIGYSVAVALQYVFQLQWTIKPVLIILLIASFAALSFIFLCVDSGNPQTTETENQSIPFLKLILSVGITLAMLMFITYYTSYIHHLQITSGYTDYNVYSWPRLLMIPTMLLSGFIGDIKKGRFMPLGVLCMVMISLLNTAVLGRDTYLLNMCLYYNSLSAVVAYYHLTFLRLAPNTKRPALWSGMGRLLDSLSVIIAFALQFSQQSMTVVLIIDIALLAVALIFMAFNGDFNFSAPKTIKIVETVSVPVAAVDPFPVFQDKHGITASEMKVLRELVLTDDKQDIIAARLGISVSTLRHHVTSIYKKTDTQTRSALCKLADKYRQA